MKWVSLNERKRPKPALIGPECENRQPHYPVDRGICYQTLVCCFSASGNAEYFLLLSANRGVLAMFDCGVRENIDLQIKTINSPYTIADIFIEYLRNTLIPAVESNQRFLGA
jgi:hypothetical protein